MSDSKTVIPLFENSIVDPKETKKQEELRGNPKEIRRREIRYNAENLSFDEEMGSSQDIFLLGAEWADANPPGSYFK